MLRKWLFRIIVIIFVWYIVSRFTEVRHIALTLSQGKFIWIGAAALCQLFYFVLYSLLYHLSFEMVDVENRWRDLIPVSFAALFSNVVAPTGGFSGAALFVDTVARRGQSAARAAVGTLLAIVLDLLSFGMVLVFGLLYLWFFHQLQLYELIAAEVLLGLLVALSGILILGMFQPRMLHRLMRIYERSSNWVADLLTHPRLHAGWAESHTDEITKAAKSAGRRPLKIIEGVFVGLASHAVSLISLYFIFLAFHQTISFQPLVAGFSMATLFWVVSITPQGIGVVEGVMTLVFVSLGVTGEIAAAVAIAFRGLSFWLPLFIGFLMVRRLQFFKGEEQRLADEGVTVKIAGWLTLFVGLVNLFSGFRPVAIWRFRSLLHWLPLVAIREARLTSVIAGFALIAISWGLFRRKQAAWLMAVAALSISIVAHLAKGLDIESALVAMALLTYLIVTRREFHAKSDRPSVQQGVTALILAFIFTLAYGAIGFYLLDRQFSVNFSLLASLKQTALMFIQIHDPGLVPITGFGHYFAISIYGVAIATFSYGLFMLLRPVLVKEPSSELERSRARQIIEEFGRSSLARIALLPDKSYYFSSGGSVVSYSVRGRIAVVLGDPIGSTLDYEPAITEFRQFAQGHDWQVAFYQTLPETLSIYRRLGFKSVKVGHEAIVKLKTFTLRGSENKTNRNAYQYLSKRGFTTELFEPPLEDWQLYVLRQVSDEWLSEMSGGEKQFSLGWFEDAYIRNSFVMTVISPSGELIAFVNLVPEYSKPEVAVDLMRRRSSTPPGVMDFLLVSAIEWAKGQNYPTFNLGLSPLFGIGRGKKDSTIERALSFIYEHINQFYRFKGVSQFKGKFNPRWSPRYLIYPSAASLLPVTLAILEADAGSFSLHSYLRHLVVPSRGIDKS